jgi:hypothetical protein
MSSGSNPEARVGQGTIEAGAHIMLLFTRRRDEPFRLLSSTETDGRLSFDHYATVVPVRFRGRQVETCFVVRWDVNVARARAVNTSTVARTRPGEPGYRRFRNLKLTLSPDDPVRISRFGQEFEAQNGLSPTSAEVEIRILQAGQGRAEFSVATPSDQIVDLIQFDEHQGLQIREMIVKLNRGDTWDHVADL